MGVRLEALARAVLELDAGAGRAADGIFQNRAPYQVKAFFEAGPHRGRRVNRRTGLPPALLSLLGRLLDGLERARSGLLTLLTVLLPLPTKSSIRR